MKSSCKAALVAALAAIALATGCTKIDEPPGPRAAHVLRIADIHEPQSLSPLVAFTQSDIAYDQLFCQTLVRAGGSKRVLPQLVTRVPSRDNGDVSADGRHITYHLRHDVRFADGVLFTARDVVFTYRALWDPRNRTASLEPYRHILALRARDPFTIDISLKQPWNAAVGSLFAAADFAYGILPAHAFHDTMVKGSSWEQTAFGTGPFHVVEWRRGDRIVLDRNPYFRPLPRLQRIVLQTIPDYETARIALLSGAVDIAPILPVNVETFHARPSFHVIVNELNGFRALALQTQRPPTSDRTIRLAIAQGIDLHALAKISFGIEKPVRSFLAPPIVTWKPQPAAPPYAFDPAAARRALDAAGWRIVDGVRRRDGRTLSVLYAVNADDGGDVRRAIAIEAQLAALGIAVEIKSYPGGIYTSPDGPVRGGRFNLAGVAGIAGDDPEQSVVHTCAQAHGGINYSHYCQAAFERLFADQASTPSETQRTRDFDDMERLTIDAVAMVPLFQYEYIVAVANSVEHYRTDYLEYPVTAETWDVR